MWACSDGGVRPTCMLLSNPRYQLGGDVDNPAKPLARCGCSTGMRLMIAIQRPGLSASCTWVGKIDYFREYDE